MSYSKLLLPSIWAIHPDELAKIEHNYSSHLRESKFEKKAILNNPEFRKTDITKNGDVGILNIEGIISQKTNIFAELFGGATLDTLTEDLKSLIEDDEVKTIVLNIDSPGGMVSGVQTFANLVFEARKSKTVLAHSSSIMTSAAMWIGSAASKVFISDDTVTTGSIGVLVTHFDVSGFEEKIGVKTTEITAGKFKRIASSHAPLSDEGRAELQSQVDHIMDVFTRDVAKFRGVSTQDVLTNMSNGEIFIGRQGIDAGLLDGILTMDELLAEAEDGNISNIEKIKKALFVASNEHDYLEYKDIFDKYKSDESKSTGDLAIALNHAMGKKNALATQIQKTKDVPNEAVCSDLKEQWESDSSLRDEFRSYEIYEAFFTHAKNSKIIGGR